MGSSRNEDFHQFQTLHQYWQSYEPKGDEAGEILETDGEMMKCLQNCIRETSEGSIWDKQEWINLLEPTGYLMHQRV